MNRQVAIDALIIESKFSLTPSSTSICLGKSFRETEEHRQLLPCDRSHPFQSAEILSALHIHVHKWAK